MATGSRVSDKKQTLEEIIEEIKRLQDMITSYQSGDIASLGPFSYPAALQRLRYLRVRQTQFKKKSV
jgi:hypothetical protein